MKCKNLKFLLQINLILLLFPDYSLTKSSLKIDLFSKYVSRFRGIECKNIHNTTAYTTKCFIKNYSRYKSTFNIIIQTVKPLVQIYMQLVTSYRYGNIYRNVLDTKIVNWCEVQRGSMFNPVLNMFLDIIRESVPSLFQECPYEGLLEFYNVTFNDDLNRKLSVFSDGQYKFNVSVFDRPNRIMFYVAIFGEIKSPIKTSFG